MLSKFMDIKWIVKERPDGSRVTVYLWPFVALALLVALAGVHSCVAG